MKTIKTKQQLFEMNGELLKNPSGSVVLLGTVLSNVMGGKVSNPDMGWKLGKKFATEDTVDLLAEEVVFVKKEINDLATRPDGWLQAVIAGQIIEILDAKDEPVEGIKKTEDDK